MAVFNFTIRSLRPVCPVAKPLSLTSHTRRNLSTTVTRSSQSRRVAVLHQAIGPPVIDGIRKPAKPGGYQDSGSDILFNLHAHGLANIVTPHAAPDPADQTHWTFPDTESGILSALEKGATHLWANTILFSSHPLQTSAKIGAYSEKGIRVVGQPPSLVEKYDNKEYTNDLFRNRTDGQSFTMPRAWSVSYTSLDASNPAASLTSHLSSLDLPFPIVAKPIRGRGSSGVKLCATVEDLSIHVAKLLKDSSKVMLEEYLAGEEATVTVMPPSTGGKTDHYALPIVTRFNHTDGIAPYSGKVAVTVNSRVVTPEEFDVDPAYEQVARETEAVARILRVTAPIRVDVRRKKDGKGELFRLFDINMKPNMTGPGRPGRDDQASLTAMAAGATGWDYPRLLKEILDGARPLGELRRLQ